MRKTKTALAFLLAALLCLSLLPAGASAANAPSGSMTLSPPDVTIDAYSSATVSIDTSTNTTVYCRASADNAGIVTTEWGAWSDSGTRLPLIVTGLSVGNVTLTVTLHDGVTGKLLDTKTVSITVLPKTYVVAYNANGGTGAPASQRKTQDVELTLSDAEPTRDGWEFLGWAYRKTAAVPQFPPGGSYTNNNSATLYAVWKPITYAVTFDANGGDDAPAQQTKIHDLALALPNAKPMRSGYTFRGWAADSTADAAQYQPGGSYTDNADVTLYAVWEEDAPPAAADGWTMVDGDWYCYQNGVMLTNAWAKSAYGWCWLDSDGRVTVSRWVQYNGTWYYLNAYGLAATNTWARGAQGWYWLGSDGRVTVSQWVRYDGAWYYMNASGLAATNTWAKGAYGWCWLGADGHPVVSQWIQYNGAWYYLNAFGYVSA